MITPNETPQVENRLQRLMTSPGGVSRETALAHADEELSALKPSLYLFMASQADALLKAIATMASGTSDFERWRLGAIAAAEKLRDTGTVADYPLVSCVAKTLCEVLEVDSNPDGMRCRDIIDCHIAALALAMQPHYRLMKAADVPALVSALSQSAAIAASRNSPASGSEIAYFDAQNTASGLSPD